jgi:hypothetical protein
MLGTHPGDEEVPVCGAALVAHPVGDVARKQAPLVAAPVGGGHLRAWQWHFRWERRQHEVGDRCPPHPPEGPSTRLHKLVQLLLGPLPVPGVLPRHVVAVEERVGVLVQHGARKLLGGLTLGATPGELAPAARLPRVLGHVQSGGRGATSAGCPHWPGPSSKAYRRAGGQAQLRAHALLHPACEVAVHERAWQAEGSNAAGRGSERVAGKGSQASTVVCAPLGRPLRSRYSSTVSRRA